MLWMYVMLYHVMYYKLMIDYMDNKLYNKFPKSYEILLIERLKISWKI